MLQSTFFDEKVVLTVQERREHCASEDMASLVSKLKRNKRKVMRESKKREFGARDT